MNHTWGNERGLRNIAGKIMIGQSKYRTFIINLKGIGPSTCSMDWIQLVHDLDHC